MIRLENLARLIGLDGLFRGARGRRGRRPGYVVRLHRPVATEVVTVRAAVGRAGGPHFRPGGPAVRV